MKDCGLLVDKDDRSANISDIYRRSVQDMVKDCDGYHFQDSKNDPKNFGNYKYKKSPSAFISNLAIIFCRGDRIRTCDTLVPNQVRYRAALHPECYPISEMRCKGINFFLSLQIICGLF